VEELRRAEAPYRFHIPYDIIPRLRQLQSRQKWWSDAVDLEDVVHLYYGLGPAMFLSFDGRVITDDSENFIGAGAGVYEVTDPKEAWVGVAIGADVWGVSELLRLLPERRYGASDCPMCKGSGWIWPTEKRPRGNVVCWDCGTLGWLPSADAEPSPVDRRARGGRETHRSPRRLGCLTGRISRTAHKIFTRRLLSACKPSVG
jgi:hypothetical protein